MFINLNVFFLFSSPSKPVCAAKPYSCNGGFLDAAMAGIFYDHVISVCGKNGKFLYYIRV